MEVALYLVKNNLALEQFGGLVELCIQTGAPKLRATRQACNATYTSPQIVHELLSSLSDTVDEILLTEMRNSQTFSLMMDKASIKNLGVIIKYIDETGIPRMRFLHDKEMTRSTGQDIKEATLNILDLKSLNPKACTNLTSDGASSFAGKRNGAAALLKANGMTHAVVMHCHDHRLALACRDAFKEIKLLDNVSEFLDSLYKYYKYSSVSAATLKHLQAVYNSANWRIQQAKHHRWLSYDKAILAVLKGLSIITEDLANAASAESREEFTKQRKNDASALHKWLTEEKTIRILCLLGDVLPYLAELSLLFQRKSVDLTYIQPKLDITLNMLKMRENDPGQWEKKMLISGNNDPIILKHNCPPEKFKDEIRLPFLKALQVHIGSRFVNLETVSSLTALALPMDFLSDLPALYKEESIRSLAADFGLEEDLVLAEWIEWLQFVASLEFPEFEQSSHQVLGKLLLQRDSPSSVELTNKWPNISYLYSVANTLCLSSADVERLFSHLKIIKSDKRTSLTNKVLNWVLNVKLNIDREIEDRVKKEAARNWASKRQRR